jgi:hypothetical protein
VKRSGWTCGSKASDHVPDRCFCSPAVYSALPVTRAPLARITQNSCYLSPPHAARVYAAYLSPFELYTAVHTIAQYEPCNSLIYKDKQLRRKWLSDCDRDGIPSCCWANRRTGEEPK